MFMKRSLALLLLAATPVMAQVPQAVPVDPTLQADPGNDMFQRAKNVYDQGSATRDPAARTELLLRAAAIFNDYLNQFPNHPNAEPSWLYMGQSLYLSGKVDEAKRCFSTLLNRYGKGPWAGAAAFTLAQDHYSKREYVMAAPLFERYAENATKPEEKARGHFYAAFCYRSIGKDAQAITLYKGVIDDPAGAVYAPQSRLGLGLILLKTNKYDQALPLFESVATTATATPAVRGEAALKAALAATQLDRTELAEKYLKMIAITPGMEDYRPDAVVALMNNAFSKKDYDSVLDAYRKSGMEASDAIDAPPETKVAPDIRKGQRLMLAGRASFQLKKMSDAQRLFRQVERSLPPQDELAFQAAYYRLLCFFESDGASLPDQVDAFIQIYKKSRPNDTKIHQALLMKAEALFNRNDFAKAAQAYSEVDVTLVSESNRPGLLYKRGWCLAEASDQQGAIRSFSKFITDYPKDPRVMKAIAKRASCHVAAGEAAKAIEDYDRLIASEDEEFTALAWVESARMRRDDNNIPDMIARYRGLLTKGGKLSSKLEAEANYFIGWGLAKTNDTKGSVTFLEKARSLQPETFAKHAGLLLALGYYSAQNLDKVSEEIDLAIEKSYAEDLPVQTLQWAGMQSYYANRYPAAARYLERMANPDEPRETPKEVWRYLGKSLIETGKPEQALKAIEHALEVEENIPLKADALLDKARALHALKRDEEARKIVDQVTGMKPEGRIRGVLQMLSGDLKMNASDPAGAIEEYIYVVQWIDDRELKPLALFKLANALEKKGDTATAEKYREQLKKEFATWQPPAP